MANSSSGEGGVLRELLAVFGFGVDTKELDKGVKDLRNFAKAVTGAFLVKEIVQFATAQTEAMMQIKRTAASLDISTDKVQQFQFASEALGLSADDLRVKMGRLQVEQSQAAQGVGKSAEYFQLMGISIRDAAGKMKDIDALFFDVADSISKETDASKQAYLATRLFGRGGRELLPVLKQGRAELEKLFALYKDLGGGYSQQMIETSSKFRFQQAKLDVVTNALSGTIAAKLLPVLGKIVEFLIPIIKTQIEWIRRSNIVQAVLITLTAIATKFAIRLALANIPLLVMVAGFVALALAIDDVITFMEGGDSLIGRFLDKVYGKDASTEAIEKLKIAWRSVGESLYEVWQYLKNIGQLMLDVGSDWSHPIESLGNQVAYIANGGKLKNMAYESDQRNGYIPGGGASGQEAYDRKRQEVLGNRHTARQLTASSGANADYLKRSSVDTAQVEGPLSLFRMQHPATAPGGASVGDSMAINAPITVNMNGHPDDPGFLDKMGKQIKNSLQEMIDDAASTLPRAPTTQ